MKEIFSHLVKITTESTRIEVLHFGWYQTGTETPNATRTFFAKEILGSLPLER
jgi:hypothetical protein